MDVDPIRILIAVAVRVYRDGLASALNAHPRLCVVGTAASPPEAQAAARHFQPDIAIVDASLYGMTAWLEALRVPGTRILALAVREDIASVLACAEAGADGFLASTGSVLELVEAIERTAAGELLCSPRIAAQLLHRASHRPGAAALSTAQLLTQREQQVFALLKQGRSNKEIASTLTIAEATVKNHVHHVLEKLRVGTRGQAAAASLPMVDAAAQGSAPRRAS